MDSVDVQTVRIFNDLVNGMAVYVRNPPTQSCDHLSLGGVGLVFCTRC